MSELNPNCVISCIGIINPLAASPPLTVSSFFPHRLAMLCNSIKICKPMPQFLRGKPLSR